MTNIKKIETLLQIQETSLSSSKKEYRKKLENIPNKRTGDYIQFPVFPKIYSTDPIFIAQKWLYSGFVIVIDDIQILIDPGIEMLTRLRLSGINPVKTTHLIITHAHIDHINDMDLMIENMSYKTSDFKGTIIAPALVINKLEEGNFRGCRGIKKPFNLIKLGEKDELCLSKKIILKSYSVNHPDTYGVKIISGKDIIGYTSDTGYSRSFKTTTGVYNTGDNYDGNILNVIEADTKMAGFFADSSVLIANLNEHLFRKHSTTHLSTFDLIHLLSFLTPRKCIITHIAPFQTLKSYRTDMIAKFIELKTGVNTDVHGTSGLFIRIN